MESILRVDGLPGTELLMLPLAFSVGMIGNALALWFFFEYRHATLIPYMLRRTAFESFAAAVAIGFVTYQCLNIFDSVFDLDTFIGIFMQGAVSGIIGIIFGLALLKLLQSRELFDITASLKKRFWKTEVIASEMPEL